MSWQYEKNRVVCQKVLSGLDLYTISYSALNVKLTY